MDIDIQNEKINLIQWLTTLDDTKIIQKIIDLRRNETTDWWDSIPELEKESVENGLSNSKEGKLKPNSEAQKIYEKWL